MKTCVRLLFVVAVLLAVGCSRLGRTAEEMRQTIALADSMNKAYVPMDSLGEQLQAAADYYDRHGSANEQVRAHYLLGCVYRDRGEAPEALQHYHDAADRSDTTATDCDFALLARVHGQMAELFFKQSMYKESLCENNKAENFAWIAKDSIAAINFFCHRATYHEGAIDADCIIAISERAYQYYMAIGDEKSANTELGASIISYLKLGDYRKAKECLDKYEFNSYFSEEAAEKNPTYYVFYYNKGMYFLYTHQFDSAAYYFNKELHSTSDLNNVNLANEGLYLLYRELGDKDSIVKYADLFRGSIEKNLAELSYKNLQTVNALYNYSRHQHIAQVKTEEAARNMVLLFLTFLLFIITILIADYAYRRKKRQQRDELERLRTQFSHDMAALEQAQHDLYSIKENELSSLIDEKTAAIARLQKRLSMANEESLTNNSICQKLHHIARTPKSEPSRAQWQELHDLVSRELPAFYGIVNGGKRRLTDEEYRICMLTRLGFSVTEISLLTGQTVKVLATKRARLLKKIFGIEGGAETFDQRIREIFADATN